MDSAAELPPARFSDRFNAFSLDLSLFSSGYFLTAMAVYWARGGTLGPGFYGVWMGLWMLGFVAYHAYYGSEGRVTLGKRLLGLRVESADGGPVEFSAALVRACSYLLSSLFFCLGFLWALKGGRAWHDKIAGTRVVEAVPKTTARRALSYAGAAGLGLAMFAGWLALVVVGPEMAHGKVIVQARLAVKSLAYLEEKRHAQTGAYTADVSDLLGFSDEAKQIASALPFNVHVDSIHITLDGAAYLIEATALDDEGTVLRLQGPVTLTDSAR